MKVRQRMRLSRAQAFFQLRIELLGIVFSNQIAQEFVVTIESPPRHAVRIDQPAQDILQLLCTSRCAGFPARLWNSPGSCLMLKSRSPYHV